MKLTSELKNEIRFCFDTLMKYSSFFGSLVFIAYAFLLMLIFSQFKFAKLYLIGSIAVMAVEYAVKLTHRRKRPDFKQVHPKCFFEKFQESGSFPSGHSANMSLFTTLIYFLFGNSLFAYFFTFISILTGISRIYLHRHYVSDVFGGYVLGILIGVILGIASF